MSQNVIELNGKRYDAITGAYLGKSHVIPKHITDYYVHGKVIDGFVRPARPAHAKKAEPLQEKVAEKIVAHKVDTANPKSTQKHTRPAASHIKAHHPEHAKTLRQRHAQKPEFSLKPAIKTQAPAEIMAKPQSALAHKRSAYGVDPARKQRASLTNQHHTIRHFGTGATHSITAQVPVIAVRPTPPHVAAKPLQPVKRPTDIFEAAMAHATSHEQPMHKAKRRRGKSRLVNTLAIVGTFLVIGGFISYLNLPGIELRVASIQAGFGASMPTYAPTGYALQDGVQRSGGTISLRFRSGDSSYLVTQQSSNWNSQTLLDNTLALNGKHETVQENGQTIYIYANNGTNAAWVSGGVRYDITGNAQLSKDDITAIATSL